MLEVKTKKELAGYAHNMARGLSLVRYRNTIYIPADFETRETDPAPDPERTMWIPLNREDLQMMAAEDYDVLFATDGELSSFIFMVAQNCQQHRLVVPELLVRTHEGLRMLDDKGALVEPHGGFVPNTLHPMLNTDEAAKKEVFDIVAGWLDSDEEADSLLTHLATCLAPGYSAVKYVLLLGGGRNGKSTLMKMLSTLIGRDNISHVTRQDISAQSPVVTELNGKLLNLVYDGQAEYLKDSGAEKTLIAGEPYAIRRLYESTPTMVQTTALYVEGLQHEPKTKDKSTALQKRLVRFQFPNVYALNIPFERRMLQENRLGAFLSLLIDRYVREDEVAERLQPTSKALELQYEHMYTNSLGLQFLKYLVETDGLAAILGVQTTELGARFKAWRVRENDLSSWTQPAIDEQFAPLLDSERKSIRTPDGPRKVRVITSLKTEAQAFLDSLEGSEDDNLEEVVGD